MQVQTQVRGIAGSHEWELTGPSPYEPETRSRWYGPDSIWACLEAQQHLEPVARVVARDLYIERLTAGHDPSALAQRLAAGMF